MRITTRLIVMFATAAACATTAAERVIHDPPRTPVALSAGCYHVQVGPWSETGQPKGLVPPAAFRLDTAVSRSGLADFETRRANGERVRVALPEVGHTRKISGIWYPVGSDSLRITWHTGFEMGGYRLALRGDSVVGSAVTWSDMRTGQPDPTAPVAGTRTTCTRSTL